MNILRKSYCDTVKVYYVYSQTCNIGFVCSLVMCLADRLSWLQSCPCKGLELYLTGLSVSGGPAVKAPILSL